MSSWRIREIENQIRDLESKQMNCSSHNDEWHGFSSHNDEWYEFERKINDLKDELRRLKRREEDEENENMRRHLAFSIGIGSLGGSHGGGFGGFGGGGFGGSGSGGSW